MTRSRLDRLKISRDGVLFVTGLLGVAHETLIATDERTSLLVLFAAMMGLPAFLRHDEATKEESSPAPPSDKEKAT